jgi:hypothetical protein
METTLTVVESCRENACMHLMAKQQCRKDTRRDAPPQGERASKARKEKKEKRVQKAAASLNIWWIRGVCVLAPDVYCGRDRQRGGTEARMIM